MKAKRILLSVSICLLLISSLLLSSCSSKTPTPTTSQPTIIDRMAASEARLSTLEANDSNLSSRIASLEKTPAQSTSQTSITQAIDTANDAKSKATDALNQSKTVQTTLDQYKSQIESNNTKILDLNSKISDLQSQITALKATPTPTPTATPTNNNSDASNQVTNGNIIVSIKDIGTEILAGTNSFDSTETIKLSVTNNNQTSISGLRLYIYLEPDSTFSPKIIDGKMSLGGDISCSLVSSSSDLYEFKTSKITVSAGKTKVFYLTPTVSLLEKAFMPYIEAVNYDSASPVYTSRATYDNIANALNPDFDSTRANTTDNPKYLDSTGTPTTYKYTDAATNLKTNSATGNNKINNSYISDDISFDETVEIIDYNID